MAAPTRWAGTLGFALGGFFDGILLHQILQWHHLLSLVPGMADLRLQVLWDGYFHALMYLIAALGLWGLWRTRGRLSATGPRPAIGALLIGFGLWHIIDGLLSHWLLGIHRIRLDSEVPLFWDLLWFTLFGLLPAVLGWWLQRSTGSGRGLRPAALVAILGLVTGAAGLWALRPPPGQAFATAVFRAGIEPADVMAALAETDARLVWADAAMGVVVLDIPADRRWRLYRHGALLVSGTALPSGCFDWSRA
ncbi:hypothetical protein GCM10007276_33770 [Agaricicola taiwanensis]|uniref:DUF2243 domain-containing protein n=1 Tax=Agaricicola taiwanensis TaxID=591372 RepID=A0A8J2YMU1_9RHOB|nr:DUF2243 domain-containing protein [Agaricicola taiwanensis]GGE53917.1 hypothetical protein GCM10007276_33770 [Agaricicola taiwanensis]